MARHNEAALYGGARELHDLLTRLRAANTGLSVRAIARKAGLSAGHVSEVFNARKTPSPDVAERLAQALSASVPDQRAARYHAERAAEDILPPEPVPEQPYLLRFLPSGQRRESGPTPPSRLLAAAAKIVPFFGRVNELETLAAWCDAAAPARSALLLHGTGGQGKTRLAHQFADARKNWTVVQSIHRSEPAPRARPVPRQRFSRTAGVLVVVDYAERWPVEDLLALAVDTRFSTSVPVRLLLLARPSGAWWDVVSTRIGKLEFAAEQLALTRLAPGTHDKTDAFATACKAFATELEMPGAESAEAPPCLHEEGFAHALTLYMAALAAVEAHTRGDRPPDDPAGLSAYLLARERDHWQSMHDKASQPLRTSPALMARAVYTATACGAQTHEKGVALLGRVGLGDRAMDLLDDHAICYPASSDAAVLEPLVPDRLGEDFLALQTPGHALADHRPDPWAAHAVAGLLAAEPAEVLEHASRTVTVFIEAAHRWPHIIQTVLNPLLLGAPHLLVTAGGAAMTRYADLPGIDMRVCEAIESQFLDGRHFNLDGGIAAIVSRLTSWRLTVTTDQAKSAHLEIDLGWRLAMAGRYEEAVTATESAVTRLRSLPEDERRGQTLAQATSFRNLAIWLNDVGQREEALKISQEAVELFQVLADVNPRFRGELALALSNHGGRLSEAGRSAEAIQTIRRAIGLFRIVVTEDPSQQRFLAMALSNLSGLLAEETGSDAVGLSEEAIEVSRRLVAREPAAHLPLLAAALNTSVRVLAMAGRPADAIDAGREATRLYRVVAEPNPGAFGLKVAIALRNLAEALKVAGHPDEAVMTAREAIAAVDRTLETHPHAYDPHISRPGTLFVLAAQLARTAQVAEALETAMAAAELSRDDRAPDVLAVEPDLAELLGRLAAKTAGTGGNAEAFPANVLQVELLRRLVTRDSGRYRPALAVALVNFGSRAARLGELDTAVNALEEALDLRRLLAEADPASYQHLLTQTLYNLGVAWNETGRAEEALDLFEEAAMAGARGPNDADLTEAILAELDKAGQALRGTGDHGSSARAFTIGLPLVEERAKSEPKWGPRLAIFLYWIMITLWDSGSREQALVSGERSVRILRTQEGQDAMLAYVLFSYGVRLSEMGRHEEALAALNGAVRFHRRAADKGRTELLANMLHALAKIRLAALCELEEAGEDLIEAAAIHTELIPRAPEENIQSLLKVLHTTVEVAEALGLAESAAHIRTQIAEFSNSLRSSQRSESQ